MKPDPGPSRLPQSLASNLPEFGQTGFLFSVRLSFLPFCVLLLLVISAGCARPPAPVERPPGVPFETGKLKERSDFWSDYQCKFRLMVDSKTSKFSSRAIVLV